MSRIAVGAAWRALAFACAAAVPARAQHYLHAGDIDAMPAGRAAERIAYGPDSLEFGELRVPTGARAPYPVAVIIHGGCWVARYATLRNTAPLANALAGAGIATWNAEYRRADRPGGGWPGTFEDVGRAVDFIRTLAPKYGLDTTRVIVMGHSAGGHLALWVAARRRLPATSALAPATTPLSLRGVVALAGPPDLRSFYAPDTASCGEGVGELLGGPPAREAERARDGSPSSFFPLGVRQIWLGAADDRIVPPAEQLAPWAAAARRAGDRVTFTVVPRSSHFELIAPGTEAYRQVLAAVQSLLGGAP
ncbi:MAG: alpha/beta hydrolase [Gemmatimonadales bacterium]